MVKNKELIIFNLKIFKKLVGKAIFKNRMYYKLLYKKAVCN